METNVIGRMGRVILRPTTEHTVDFVVRTEHDPVNARFIFQWTRDEHLAAAADPTVMHAVIVAEPDDRLAGYAVLRGLNGPHRSIELMRIAMVEHGQGLGREAVRLLKQLSFKRFGAHRLWLDVMDHNERARGLYHSEGFVEEGILRDAIRHENRFVSLTIMSILENEYREA